MATLRPVQRMKEARRCQENKRPGRGWAEAARLVWRVQDPWARLRLERQREVRLREAGARPSRRARHTRRLQRTVTNTGGEEGEMTNNSVRKQRNVARWGRFLEMNMFKHNSNSCYIVSFTLGVLLTKFCSRSRGC